MSDPLERKLQQLEVENQRLRQRLDSLTRLECDDPVLAARDTILETTLDAVYVKDLDGRYLWVNEAGARIAGMSADAVIGRTAVDIFGSESAAKLHETEQRSIDEGTVITQQEQLCDPHGDDVHFLSRKGPCLNRHGDVIGTFGVARDISDHVQVADALQRERDSRALAEEAGGVGVWDFDRVHDNDYASPDYLRILGLAADAEYRSASTFWACVHPDDREKDRARLYQAMAERRERLTMLHRVVWKDGSIHWVNAVSRLEYGASGDYARWYGTMVDVTVQHDAKARLQNLVRERTQELSQALEQVRQSEQYLRHLFGAIEDAILVHDAEGNILDCNDSLCEVLGYSREELLTMNTSALDSPEFAAGFHDRMDEQLDHGRHRCEGVHRTRDGELVPIDIISSVMEFHGKGAVVAVLRNISQRKRAEAEKEALTSQIQHKQKLESLGVLSGGIAHDFNNLLMGVLGNADLALEALGASSPVQDELHDIQSAARTAADLCRQLLAYSGKGRFVVQALDFNAVISDMRSLIDLSANKRANVTYRLSDGLPAVEADSSQISQIVMNLIVNAAESIDKSDGLVTVATEVIACDDAYLNATFLDNDCPPGRYVSLEVSDNGCGMGLGVKGKIFDPFFTTKQTGRGLGLAAVSGIVRGHGGTMRVYSEVGQGTTFKLLFPASEISADPLPPTVESCDWRGEGVVLVVDDEITVQKVARRILECKGFDVLIANDGREAVELFAARHSDVAFVLLDLTMPTMGGQEAFRELRRIDENVRVILSSGYNQQDAVNRFAGKGLASFVQKPYRAAQLSQTVYEVLEGTQCVSCP